MSDIEKRPPTYRQLERDLSHIIQRLYRQKIGHCPDKIVCKLLGNNFVIIIENAITTIEKSLLEQNNVSLAKSFNLAINNAIKSELKTLIEEGLAVEVCEILLDSSLDTKHAGGIVILSQIPVVRSQKPITKTKKTKYKNKYIDENSFNQTFNNLNLAVIMLYLSCLKPDKDMQPDIYLWKITSNLDK